MVPSGHQCKGNKGPNSRCTRSATVRPLQTRLIAASITGPQPTSGGHLICPRQPRPRNFSHPSALDHRRPPSILTIQLGRLRETSASRRPELKAGLLFAAARNEKRRLGPPVLGGVFV